MTGKSSATNVPQWIPTQADIESARITDFARFVTQHHGVRARNYSALWQWSVDDVAGFWRAGEVELPVDQRVPGCARLREEHPDLIDPAYCQRTAPCP